jgi:subtilisin family serine protease
VLDCTETGRISDAAAGIRYAARTGAQVIVVAFGTPGDSRVLREATAEAVARSALVVASAGNDGADERIQFPAGYPGVLAVAGTGYTDGTTTDYARRAPFSNVSAAVGLFAPALGILGPVPAALCTDHGWRCLEGDTAHARASGTSFAAPLVAGAVALLYSAHPGLTAGLATALLTESASPVSGSPVPGVGQLDVAAALSRPLYEAGLPGTGRAGGADERIPGPAQHQRPPSVPTPAPTPAATATPVVTPPQLPPAQRTPVPPNTGGGPA